MKAIGTTRVEEVMTTVLITVLETDAMEVVATIFNEQDIHAAPVVDRSGKCVGIITSHDMVEYETVRQKFENELIHGTAYNLANYKSDVDMRWPGLNFDEVAFHMTKAIEPAAINDPLSRVARTMCATHRHHALVLDENGKPIGMISSLDLLGFVIGEPVCRTATCHKADESS